MSTWLDRLKNQNIGYIDATKPAKPKVLGLEAGSVGLVASPQGPLAQLVGTQTCAQSQAMNDEQAAVSDGYQWGWPHSLAANSKELESVAARIDRFTDRGMSYAEAEELAYRLVTRDLEGVDQRLCLECASLNTARGWRCSNWRRADVPRDGIPRDFVMLLQRCPGYFSPEGNRA